MPRSRIRMPKVLRAMGPGLVTGASDDDPSGIATYSQIGAQFGYTMLWPVVLVYPLMAAIQEISARVGRVAGRGIAGCLSTVYPRWVVLLIVGAMATANIINLGADIAAIGAAARLLVGGPSLFYAVLFTGGSLVLQVFIPYTRYVRYLKWLTLALFAYVATVFVVDVSWADALRHMFLPHIVLEPRFLVSLVAVLGTTISPYLFFWQASQEVEEVHTNPAEKPLKEKPEQGPREIRRIKLDTYIGMAFSNLISFFIILAAAATLHVAGHTNINTAAEAAEALRPLAGPFAFLLFSAGIIGTGLLALPVLAGSAAYAVGEALHWRTGLQRKPHEARGFYGVLIAATLIGLSLDLISVNPIAALFWSAVVNGVVAVPVMAMIMLVATNRKVMGKFVLPVGLTVAGWIATGVMTAAAFGLFWTL